MSDHSLSRDDLLEEVRASNARYLNLVNSIPDWIWEVDAQNRFVYSSPSVRQILGYEPEEVIGRTPLDFMPPSEVLRVEKLFSSVAMKQKPFNGIENTNRHRDGHLVVLETSGNPIWGRNGEFAGYLGIDRDITARKRVEKALQESESSLLSILGSSADGILAVDASGRVLNMNQRFISMLHVPPSLLENKDDEALLAFAVDQLADPEEFVREVRRLYSSDEIASSSLMFKDGRIFERRSAPLMMDNAVKGRVWSFSDITERKRIEAELLKIHKLQSIGMLAGGIAHDFNNILMGLFSYISLARDELTREHPGLASLDEAGKCWERAVHLTNQLLTFAKGGVPLKEEIDLGELAREVAQFDLSGSNVKLVTRQDEDLRLAEVDKGQIQQVISNLAINACEAMPQGGHLYVALENFEIHEEGTLHLPCGDYIKITMRDEGCGIAPADLDRIFEPYFTTKAHGCGFGLATAYSIINKHGGHMGVVSELGKGTTLTLLLPASRFPPSPPIKRPAESGLTLQRPARILVMDDEQAIRDVLARMLTADGFSVETVPGGKEAIESYIKARETGAPFDVVIMDLTIPGGVGGKQTIKDLLAIDPGIRCIVSSGYADDPVMAHYAEYGFRGVAVKPYGKKKLLEVLALALK
jgi:PAS domain S-box-containing protein